MNIEQEINDHLEWIETIVSLLGKEEITEDDLQAVTQHDKCALGQWLDSEASVEFKNLPELGKLIEDHEEFHKLAGNLINALKLDKETEAIESEKQFIEMSKKVIGHLHILQENKNKTHDESNPDKI